MREHVPVVRRRCSGQIVEEPAKDLIAALGARRLTLGRPRFDSASGVPDQCWRECRREDSNLQGLSPTGS